MGREMIAREGVIRLAEITGTEEADMEDLFEESFYVDLVNRSNAAAVEAFEVQGDGRIVERIENATGTGFNRFLPARFLLEHPEALSEQLDETTPGPLRDPLSKSQRVDWREVRSPRRPRFRAGGREPTCPRSIRTQEIMRACTRSSCFPSGGEVGG